MISKTALHAVRAVIALGKLPAGGFCGASAVAAQVNAPPNYLGKLLQSLADKGIVHSQRGLGGGFRLAREPKDITLYDIVDPIDHVSRWTGCFLGLPSCNSADPCAMHHHWARVREAYLSMLNTVTLAEILGKPAKADSLARFQVN